MSISKIGVTLPHVPNVATVARPATDPASRAPVQQDQATALRTSAPTTTSRTPTTLGGPTNTLPAEAPPGTDPELWSVLTADERAYFAKAGSSGPLTYGRTTAPRSTQPTRQSPPLARGGRLDVKV
jgi:hypothetical protein